MSRSQGLDSGPRNFSAPVLTQCSRLPLPVLGTQKVLRGNGTSVGSVIVRQCPSKYQLIGKQLTCVVDRNVTRWEGESYCQLLSPSSTKGFQAAVVASMVSVAVILLMSMAFITCCWVDFNRENQKKKRQRLKETNENDDDISSSRDNRCPRNSVQVPVYTPEWHPVPTAPPGTDFNQPQLGEILQLGPYQFRYPVPSVSDYQMDRTRSGAGV